MTGEWLARSRHRVTDGTANSDEGSGEGKDGELGDRIPAEVIRERIEKYKTEDPGIFSWEIRERSVV